MTATTVEPDTATLDALDFEPVCDDPDCEQVACWKARVVPPCPHVVSVSIACDPHFQGWCTFPSVILCPACFTPLIKSAVHWEPLR